MVEIEIFANQCFEGKVRIRMSDSGLLKCHLIDKKRAQLFFYKISVSSVREWFDITHDVFCSAKEVCMCKTGRILILRPRYTQTKKKRAIYMVL